MFSRGRSNSAKWDFWSAAKSLIKPSRRSSRVEAAAYLVGQRCAGANAGSRRAEKVQQTAPGFHLEKPKPVGSFAVIRDWQH
jgi:hypothetical protein